MAVHTLYVLSTTAVTPNFWGNMQDGGTAPTAANTIYGWGPAKNVAAFFQAFLGASNSTSTTRNTTTSFIDGSTGPTKGTGTTSVTAGDSFIAGPFTGTFANTAWTFAWKFRASTAGAIGKARTKVWKSANADGSSATELTTSTLVTASAVTLSTTADVDAGFTWSPGTITLSNEYLFFQMEWQETTAGTSNGSDVLWRVGTALVTTPDLGAGAAAASLVWKPQPFQHMIIR